MHCQTDITTAATPGSAIVCQKRLSLLGLTALCGTVASTIILKIAVGDSFGLQRLDKQAGQFKLSWGLRRRQP